MLIPDIEDQCIRYEQFLRLFPMRADRLMWFLGAGCSVSSGIPTAGDIIWELKRLLYCSEHRCSIQTVPPLSDIAFRDRLNSHFKDRKGYPAAGADNEYSFYIQAAYPDERERRKYIDLIVSDKRPSIGHLALAALAKLQKASAIWTTNFDRLLEDAMVEVLGSTNAFGVASLDSPHLAEEILRGQSRPLVVKLHGDFLSRKLKNVDRELKAQDEQLRYTFTKECGNAGLAVIGYSGRDDSVMKALDEAAHTHKEGAFPAGLFWFLRTGAAVPPRVSTLIDSLQQMGVDARTVRFDTFDETLRDLFTLLDDIPKDVYTLLNTSHKRLRFVDVPPPGSGWPVIRLNALPVVEFPTVCRRVVCNIGGTKEVREAIEAANANVVAVRKKTGVICFGADTEVRHAFKPFGISDFDLHPIVPQRLGFESAEHGLLVESFIRALTRSRPLISERTRRGWRIRINSEHIKDSHFSSFHGNSIPLTGLIPNTDIRWYEAALIRLEYRLDRLFLLFEPSISIERNDVTTRESEAEPTQQTQWDETARIAVQEFMREKSAKRYNRNLIQLMDGWTTAFVGPDTKQDVGTVRALEIADGVDATFSVSRTTAFSRRLGD